MKDWSREGAARDRAGMRMSARARACSGGGFHRIWGQAVELLGHGPRSSIWSWASLLVSLRYFDLMKAVPEEHKKFLHDLVWVHEEEDVRIDTDGGQILCKLIAVHAGLEKSLDLNEQLRVLRTRDTRVPKVQMLSGRQDVWSIPQDLAGKQTIVVSGHHGKLHVDGLRFIIDEGGGYSDKPIAAVVFPSKEVIRSTEGTASQN
uniref:Uncharacterized protein n=1 Tax=Aegilops tauschii TaxID=37682 RepID=M8AQJ2_AEGTA